MEKIDALQEIFDLEGIEAKLFGRKVTVDSLLLALSKESYTLSTELGVQAGTATAITALLWPDKPKTNNKVCGWLLHKYGLRYCSKCKKVHDLEDFSKNAAKPSGYNTYCKSCYTESTRDYQREYQKTRKELKSSRVPSWANLDEIKRIYKECPEGHHVDHIIPLRGELVSGLHVETNLQYLTAQENIKKRNKYIIE